MVYYNFSFKTQIFTKDSGIDIGTDATKIRKAKEQVFVYIRHAFRGS